MRWKTSLYVGIATLLAGSHSADASNSKIAMSTSLESQVENSNSLYFGNIISSRTEVTTQEEGITLRYVSKESIGLDDIADAFEWFLRQEGRLEDSEAIDRSKLAYEDGAITYIHDNSPKGTLIDCDPKPGHPRPPGCP